MTTRGRSLLLSHFLFSVGRYGQRRGVLLSQTDSNVLPPFSGHNHLVDYSASITA